MPLLRNFHKWILISYTTDFTLFPMLYTSTRNPYPWPRMVSCVRLQIAVLLNERQFWWYHIVLLDVIHNQRVYICNIILCERWLFIYVQTRTLPNAPHGWRVNEGARIANQSRWCLEAHWSVCVCCSGVTLQPIPTLPWILSLIHCLLNSISNYNINAFI